MSYSHVCVVENDISSIPICLIQKECLFFWKEV